MSKKGAKTPSKVNLRASKSSKSSVSKTEGPFQFQTEKNNLEEIGNHSLKQVLDPLTYSKEQGQAMSKDASNAILEQLANRYPTVKFNVLTAIAEKGQSSFHMDMESMLEVGRDGTTTVKYDGNGFTALTYITAIPTD